jgi:hypothetical protein
MMASQEKNKGAGAFGASYLLGASFGPGRSSECYCAHCMDEETEAHRSRVICQSPTAVEAEQGQLLSMYPAASRG